MIWKTGAGTALLTAFVAGNLFAQDAKAVVAEATKAMGATGLNAVAYSGSAAIGNFGQSRIITFRLASTSIRNYTRAIDFTAPASRATGSTLPPAVPGGPPPQLGTFDETITSADPAWARQLQIWITPWGFLRGAAANPATVRSRKVDGAPYSVVTWIPPRKAPSGQNYQVAGYINAQQLVERVETWVEHPVMGDLHVEAIYSGYQDFDGLKVPARIAFRQAGMETFVVAITEAEANPPALAAFMNAPATTGGVAAPAAQAVPPPLSSEKLADGVYRITGGYVSLAVEFRDHVVVLESGQSEARGLAILAEVKRLIPNKPIKYLVNTHPHYDHAGGVAPFVAQGITIITDDNNKFFFEASMSSPRTLVGDALTKSKKKPKVEGVIDKLILQDATRTLELHHIEKLEHSDGMLVAYLPKERILFTADFAVPAAGQPPSPSLVTLAENVERLQLDFDRHVPVHAPNPDRPMNKADLMALTKDRR